MKKRSLPRSLALLFALLLALLPICGCVQIDPQTNSDTTNTIGGSNSKPAYLYQTMPYSYKTDASAFLSDITTGMSSSYLVLVNKQQPVTPASDLSSPTYALEKSVKITRYAAKSNMELEARTLRALYAMIEEMRADGITDVQIQSAYRTESYQTTLFNNYLNKEQNRISSDARSFFGEEYIQVNYTNKGLSALTPEDARQVANYYSAFPGQSEHHTGLCVDFSTREEVSAVGEVLTEYFAQTDAGQWLLQNAYRFGFILRYPDGKTNITGYCYEPWHYRFVGREAATEIHFRNLTLEEFLGA